jgi:hypothetical protein
MAQHVDMELLLRPEVVVDRRFVGLGLRDDRPHRGAVEATFGEQLHAGIEQALADLGSRHRSRPQRDHGYEVRHVHGSSSMV